MRQREHESVIYRSALGVKRGKQRR